MEGVLKRLGTVETHVSALRLQVSTILAVIPPLATKADVVAVKTTIADMRADLVAAAGLKRSDLTVPVGAMKADLAASVGVTRAGNAAFMTAITKWALGRC